ncbi:MAG: GntR family transcriptional regulator [Clostridiales bacterium]|jgi:DNA-binding GntR family transcriptional regulator|nr:GntR family transcriptional regulator [Clostridiales bacterium]
MSKQAPKYIEVFSKLRQALISGEYPEGSFLPTENELVRMYGVSKSTVRHAIKILRENSLIEVKQGSGAKVLPTVQKPILSAKYRDSRLRSAVSVRYNTAGEQKIENTRAAIDMVQAGETVAAALQIGRNSKVYRLQRLQLVDGAAFGYMVNYISEQMTPGLPEKGEIVTNLYDHIADHYGIGIVSAEETVGAALAGFVEAQLLRVEVNQPLIVLRRLSIGDRGPLEYCETTVRPDLFQLVITLSKQEQP